MAAVLLVTTYLILWHLSILVHVQVIKQICRRVPEPHEQVTWWHSLLKAHHFNVKDQHSAAWHTSS